MRAAVLLGSCVMSTKRKAPLTRGQRLAGKIDLDLQKYHNNVSVDSFIKGKHLSHTSRWARGEVDPSDAAVRAWAEALGRDPLDLHSWMGDEIAIGHVPSEWLPNHPSIEVAVMRDPKLDDLPRSVKVQILEFINNMVTLNTGRPGRLVIPLGEGDSAP